MEDLYRTFGALVRDSRVRLGLTQAQLGKLVGLGRTAITNIESGKQTVALHQVYELAEALGTNPNRLLPPMPGRVNEGATSNVGSLVPDAADQQLLMTIMKGRKK